MFHAGLGDVPLSVERYVLPAEDEDAPGLGGAAAFFTGIEAGRCGFYVNCMMLDDPEYLIGVLAHEVAHAFRAIHGLAVEDHEEEEELTDLTTIVLGFGIFTVNNAHQQWEYSNTRCVRRAGYLSAPIMAVALATWVHMRDSCCDSEVLERWLEPLQRSVFAKARAQLEDFAPPDVLECEAVAAWRPSVTMLSDAPDAPPGAEPIDFAAKRSDTFRVPTRPQVHTLPLGGLAGGLGAAVVTSTALWALIGALVGAALGWALGRPFGRDKCARGDCRAIIPARSARCPKCGALVQGELEHAADLYEALEALRRKRAARREARADK